jgi:hypothetical protein
MSTIAQKPQAPMTIRYDEKSSEGPDDFQYHIQVNDQCCSECQCQERQTRPSHHGRHSSRLHLLLLPALLTLLGLIAFLALSCAYSAGDLFGNLGTGIAGGLARRATGDTTTGNGPFIDRKRLSSLFTARRNVLLRRIPQCT